MPSETFDSITIGLFGLSQSAHFLIAYFVLIYNLHNKVIIPTVSYGLAFSCYYVYLTYFNGVGNIQQLILYKILLLLLVSFVLFIDIYRRVRNADIADIADIADMERCK